MHSFKIKTTIKLVIQINDINVDRCFLETKLTCQNDRDSGVQVFLNCDRM